MTTAKILFSIAEQLQVPVCNCCLHEIDPDCCHCGSPPDADHHTSTWAYTHSFIPRGCTCGYDDAERRKGTLRALAWLLAGHLVRKHPVIIVLLSIIAFHALYCAAMWLLTK